ncbi:SpoIIIAH-like family protein [Metabacillus iocasae]|uniref:Stage III sporulation protein AH n=1 Tax=Priestia iocasae TaxID=2291674 RepID=A0ABS2QS43_9BACI|nr:SpoIIIAH-like family protein [Metabacillus iocasae]MBM7701581.1 stage III sporulation protein AH [Metabacillus iocasae]
MLLKKQTVWLLTMLSLVAVLSVYYITSPETPPSNMAVAPEEEKEVTEEEKSADGKEEKPAESGEEKSDEEGTKDEEGSKDTKEQSAVKETTVVSSVDSDELFTALRLDITDERSKLRQELTDATAAKGATPEQVSKAMDKIQELSQIEEKELVLETLIKSKGYGDALVRADGGQVKVTVKAKEQSASRANDIIQLVKDELGSKQYVAVEFQPEK